MAEFRDAFVNDDFQPEPPLSCTWMAMDNQSSFSGNGGDSRLTQFCAHWFHLLKSRAKFDLMVVRFCTLLEELFGVGSQLDLFRVRSRANVAEFDAVYSLLEVAGPLFDLIDRLLQYAEFRFTVVATGDDFSFQLVPKGMDGIGGGGVGMMTTATGPSTVASDHRLMSLNAFEAYFLFFLGHVTKANPFSTFFANEEDYDDCQNTKEGSGDCAYVTLLDDYLMAYFPWMDNEVSAFVAGRWGVGQSLMSSAISSACSRRQTTAVTPSSRRFSPLGLLRLNFDSGEPLASGPASKVSGAKERIPSENPEFEPMSLSKLNASAAGGSGTGNEQLVKAYTLFAMVCDMWLTGEQNATKVACVEHCRNAGCLLFVIRRFVLAAYRFLYLAPPTPFRALVEFKVKVLQPNLRHRMLQVFEYHFLRWPLDTSYRVLLETWLTYIQPWLCNDEGERRHLRPVSSQWLSFIAENRPVYEMFFRLVLIRFSRMDLGSNIRSARMVQRLCEVFNQPEFLDLLKTSCPDTVASTSVVGSSGSYLEEPTAGAGSFWNSSETVSLVSNTVAVIESEIAFAKTYLEHLKASRRSKNWFVSVCLYFVERSTEQEVTTIKILHMLHFSSGVLRRLFHVNLDLLGTTIARVADVRRAERLPLLRSMPVDWSTDDAGRWCLTDVGRNQLLHKMATVDAEHLLLPSRDSTASAVDHDQLAIVGDLLDVLAGLVNTTCGPVFERLYRRQDRLGKVARRLLESSSADGLQHWAGTTSSVSQAPKLPHISLRRFSSVRFLFQLMALLTVAFLLFDWNPLTVFFACVLIRVSFSCVSCLLFE